MYRLFWSTTILAIAIALNPLGSSFAVPADVMVSQPMAATADDEIILIESNGRLRVVDPHTELGIERVLWDSGADIGWTHVAAGDFNGDGDAEIVAIRGSTIKVFDPVVQSSFAPVVFERTLSGDRTFRLIATGDFDKDGRDELAVTHKDTRTGIRETLKVYDGGTNATAAEWRVAHESSYQAPWRAMATGDTNGDRADDLALVRNLTGAGKLLKICNGVKWTPLAEQSYGFDWLTLAIGNISSEYAGAEIALTRSGVMAALDSLILFRVSGSSFVDLTAEPNYRYFPHFTSMALGDLNGDGDEEIVLLRDPGVDKVSLLMVNPIGERMRAFEAAIGYGDRAWRQVRMGDLDADGRAEVVVLREDRYRIYEELGSNDSFKDTSGSFRVPPGDTDTPTLAIADVDAGAQQELFQLLALRLSSERPAGFSLSLQDLQKHSELFERLFGDRDKGLSLKDIDRFRSLFERFFENRDKGLSLKDIDPKLFERLFSSLRDRYEPDNSYREGTLISTDGTHQTHNFEPTGDRDWIKFEATSRTQYTIETSNLASGSDTRIYLYDRDGTTEIDRDDDGGAGRASKITWTCPRSGTYYVMIRHFRSSAHGPDTQYDISVIGETTPPPEVPPVYKQLVTVEDVALSSDNKVAYFEIRWKFLVYPVGPSDIHTWPPFTEGQMRITPPDGVGITYFQVNTSVSDPWDVPSIAIWGVEQVLDVIVPGAGEIFGLMKALYEDFECFRADDIQVASIEGQMENAGYFTEMVFIVQLKSETPRTQWPLVIDASAIHMQGPNMPHERIVQHDTVILR